MRVWRIVRRHRIRDAFTGEGARLYGGRWNSQGVRVVYASSSLALAQLEFLVWADALDAPPDVVSIAATIPDSLRIESESVKALPRDWRRFDPPHRELQIIGDRWCRELTSVVLRVPSAVVPQEDNFLLNPLHEDFRRIVVGRPGRVSFDGRLFSR